MATGSPSAGKGGGGGGQATEESDRYKTPSKAEQRRATQAIFDASAAANRALKF